MWFSGHRQTRRVIDALVDGELHAREAERAADHMDGCPDCRREAHLTVRVKRSLRRLGTYRPADLALARLRRWAQRPLR